MIAWALRNPRLAIALLSAVLVITIWAYVTHLQHVARARKAQLAQATQTLQAQTKATQAADHVEQFECKARRIHFGMARSAGSIRAMLFKLLANALCSTNIRLDCGNIRRRRLRRLA